MNSCSSTHGSHPRRTTDRAAATAALILLAVFLPAGGCGDDAESTAEADPADDGVVLLYSGNNDGVLAACGCPGNPSGGFAKRQGLVERYRATRPNVLVVDAGNLFPERKNETKVAYLARAAERAGYDAIGLGVAEFLLGAERLREMQKEHGLPFICSNVRDDSGRLVGAPHVVCEKGGLKIGMFAVIADWAYGFPRLEWREGLEIEDPTVAARREVEALAGCDAIVAVSHQPLYRTRAFAREVEGIDVIIFGHEPKTLKTPERVGPKPADGPDDRPLLVGTGEAGNFLGALTLRRAEGGMLETNHNVTFLSAQVPGAEWVEMLYWDYVKEAKAKPPPSWDTPVPTRFESSQACGECHEPEYEQWKTTRHAHAFKPVRKAGRHEDPECVLCHTMGFGRKGGFVSMEETPALGRVTCQGCHVVTSDHEEKGVKPDPKMNISSRLCMSCHGPIQSPEFDYFVYKPKILHHPRSPEDGDADDRPPSQAAEE